MKLHPIGEVRSEVKEPRQCHWESVVSEVVVREELAPALEGLEEFSHILVVFWFHHAQGVQGLAIHPGRREDLPQVGIFATRSPVRPNPIGVTAARLLARRGNVLRVQGLDAIDGTPVLDIKPYIPLADSIPDARFPPWVERLAQGAGGSDD